MQITTPAPISLDNLKEYYKDKSTSYLIDYKSSVLKDQKLLTYLSNLDLNCDIKIEEFNNDFFSLLQAYFYSTSLVKIKFLEFSAIEVLLEFKGIIQGNRYEQFIVDNKQIVESWVSKLDSLLVYNLHTMKTDEHKAMVQSYPVDDTDSIEGINWVSLLKNEEFYTYFSKMSYSNLKYYSKYFNDYMFKGNNLYKYWATEHNPMFLVTWGLVNNKTTFDEIDQIVHQTTQEQSNDVTFN
jgi:hypothetical protein